MIPVNLDLLVAQLKRFGIQMFNFSLRMKKADMLGNTGSRNHSHRAAQEMLQLFWHPDFHHENIVIAIFTRIFYTSYIQSGGSWHPLKFHCAN